MIFGDIIADTSHGVSVVVPATAVHFDGGTYVDTLGLLTGVSSSASAAGSVWVKVASNADFGTQTFLIEVDGNGANSPVQIVWQGNSGDPLVAIDVRASTTASAEKFFFIANASQWPAAGNWINMLWSVKTDLAAGNKVCNLYFNDAAISGSTVDTSASFTIDWAGADATTFSIFSHNGGNNFLGDMAHFWFAPGQYLDFSVEANRRKFISALGKPVDLGADGSTPTGVAPAIFFTGNAAAFVANKGTGGAATTWWNGTPLTDAATSPA